MFHSHEPDLLPQRMKPVPVLRLIRHLYTILGFVVLGTLLVYAIYPRLRVGTVELSNQIPRAWDKARFGAPAQNRAAPETPGAFRSR